MPFRDRDQLAQVCRVLVTRTGLGLWQETRATAPPASPEDAVRLFRVALALWTGRASIDLSDVLQLGEPHSRLLVALLGATGGGPEAIDGWVADWGGREAGEEGGLGEAAGAGRARPGDTLSPGLPGSAELPGP